jgi:hypothetical protein
VDPSSKAKLSNEDCARQDAAGASESGAKDVSEDAQPRWKEQEEEDNRRIRREAVALVASAAKCETAETFTILLKGPARSLKTWRGFVVESSRLGIAWTESVSFLGVLGRLYPYLQVIRVEKQGLVPQWNKRNPDRQVVVLSRIVEVNGERGDCKRLSSLLLSDCELSVVVIPTSAL